ncbi:MAG TPA: DNA repair protein RecO [Methylococcaceae bacterium]|nr:DNA repair protein RecO [Methylococcaceae bacterium]
MASEVHSDAPRIAYLLHERPYRETSLIVEIFGREEGRLSLLAKGARAAGRRGERLRPFARYALQWRGTSELPLLHGRESLETPLVLHGVSLFCGLYLNELLVRFLHRHDPHPCLFDAYCNTLGVLAAAGDAEQALRRFELALLRETGYGLSLETDALSGEPVQPTRTYRYLPEHGIVPENRGPDLLSGATLLALHSGMELDVPQRREAKGLLRRIIHFHLEGKPLKSRDLFRLVQSA